MYVMYDLNFLLTTLTERILIKTGIGTKIIRVLEVESELNLFKNEAGTGTRNMLELEHNL